MRLQTALLPVDQRSLDTLTALDDLERSLFDRTPTLAAQAGAAGATASTIVSELIAEVSTARAAPPGGEAVAPGAPMASMLTSSAFDDATIKSEAFQTLAAAIAAAPQATSQDRIDLISLGFNGDCVIAVRCMLSQAAHGDPDVS